MNIGNRFLLTITVAIFCKLLIGASFAVCHAFFIFFLLFVLYFFTEMNQLDKYLFICLSYAAM